MKKSAISRLNTDQQAVSKKKKNQQQTLASCLHLHVGSCNNKKLTVASECLTVRVDSFTHDRYEYFCS